MMLDGQQIAVIGAGTMGRAITTGMIRAGVVQPRQVVITDRTPNAAMSAARELEAGYSYRNSDACRSADIVVLCVKPNDVETVVRELRDHDGVRPGALIISIAAGVSTAAIERYLGNTAPIVRAMPNTACVIGQGMTVVSAGTHATPAHLELARTIFATLGRCLVLDEKYLNVVTGLSGSGPAFLYVIMESLADGGVMCGLPRAVATELVAQVALGAAQMVLATGKHPSALKDDVTTPGGCTIAGLLAMEDGKIRSVLARTVETATRVAGGLGGPGTS